MKAFHLLASIFFCVTALYSALMAGMESRSMPKVLWNIFFMVVCISLGIWGFLTYP